MSSFPIAIRWRKCCCFWKNSHLNCRKAIWKVWRSYCSVRDSALADNDTKELIHRRVLELQQKKKLTNYRLYTDLKLNPGNVNAWLKHNDSSKMSLDCARQIYKYAKSYPSVR